MCVPRRWWMGGLSWRQQRRGESPPSVSSCLRLFVPSCLRVRPRRRWMGGFTRSAPQRLPPPSLRAFVPSCASRAGGGWAGSRGDNNAGGREVAPPVKPPENGAGLEGGFRAETRRRGGEARGERMEVAGAAIGRGAGLEGELARRQLPGGKASRPFLHFYFLLPTSLRACSPTAGVEVAAHPVAGAEGGVGGNRVATFGQRLRAARVEATARGGGHPTRDLAG